MGAPKVEIYRDSAGEWRFRAVAGNGEIVAVGEGYKNEGDAVDEARKLWPDSLIEPADDGA